MHKTFEERIQDWEKTTNRIKQTILPGLLPSPPDPRDFSVEDIPVKAVRLPEKHKLQVYPTILNQGTTPYCGGASAAGIANSHYYKSKLMPNGGFSMNFIYWLCKQYDGIPDVQGTYLRTVLKIMNKYGCASAHKVPFSPNKIQITPEAIREAENYKINSYARLNNINDIRIALNKGLYILIGTLVTHDNWYDTNGFLSYPGGNLYGGHATFLFGYDNSIQNKHQGYLFGRNSWGIEWGAKGDYFLPYEYLDMEYENRSVFLEAWGIEFEPIIDLSNNSKRKNINIRRRQRIRR